MEIYLDAAVTSISFSIINGGNKLLAIYSMVSGTIFFRYQLDLMLAIELDD